MVLSVVIAARLVLSVEQINVLKLGNDGDFLMNDWSFSQLCALARVNKDTVNRLSPETAARVFRETLPSGTKPLQVLADGNTIRSVHGVSYTRLWNIELLNLISEFASDFTPPQQASGGGTGLYAGEQDLFVFLIPPAGRRSEVRRSLRAASSGTARSADGQSASARFGFRQW